MIFELFQSAVMEFSAIVGLAVVVGSVIYCAYHFLNRRDENRRNE